MLVVGIKIISKNLMFVLIVKLIKMYIMGSKWMVLILIEIIVLINNLIFVGIWFIWMIKNTLIIIRLLIVNMIIIVKIIIRVNLQIYKGCKILIVWISSFICDIIIK